MAIAFVQAANGGTASLAYGSNNTAGNLLVAWVRLAVGTTAVISGVTDTRGNTWVQIYNVANGVNNQYALFYVKNCAGGANTITVGTVGSVGVVAVQPFIAEYSGIDLVNALDKTITPAEGVGTALAVGPVTTSFANELILGIFINQSALATYTLGASYTARTTSTTAVLADNIVPATPGSYDATATANTSVGWTTAMATFKGDTQPAQATPTFSPVTGSYGPTQSVTITSAGADTIYYTTDGSTPTVASTVYSGPVAVSVSLTLKALAVKSGFSNSAVGSAAYTINGAQATPTFSPVAGSYSSTQSVTITSAGADTIYYTTDGTTPTTGSTVYSGPVSVAVSLTLKALAVKAGFSNSAVGSAAYTITAGSTAYSVPDCRVSPAGPNSSRTVQGTKIYDVQTSSNAAVPGTDSRAAGAPTDSRVSPNIPQNSRTPGTFGPGE